MEAMNSDNQISDVAYRDTPISSQLTNESSRKDGVIPEYQSPNTSANNINGEDASNSHDGDAGTLKKFKRCDKDWVLDATYSTVREALDVINRERIWSKRTTSECDLGDRHLYRCNKVKARAKVQCSSGLYILYHNNSTSASIYRSKIDHNHDTLSERTQQVEKTVIDAIAKHVADGLRRKQIINRLHENKLAVPTKTQMNNLYNGFKQQIHGPPTVFLSELIAILNEHSTVPEDWNQAFVLDYKTTEENNIRFDFVVSSKKLLSNSIGKELFAADTTYKILWEGFPVAPIGTVDKDRHFHLTAMCVSTTEREEDFTFFFQTIKDTIFKIFNGVLEPKIILCDACKAISNAFLAVFGDQCLVLMCWFHVKKAVRKNIGHYFPKEMHQSVLDDIDCLQLSLSPQIFEIASKLFLQKYAAHAEFVSYFEYEWLQQFRNWYEGAAGKCPSTNNALESFNRYLKDERT
ncbi:hypothetical protein Bhyg_07670 [Pseudolycoriella hygida]|uniref:MULE transposase domain-containing protein n=1 Tax=Pseudolycoriella hygida TaxID=35572 RepID=A0A9Q0N435_9DIPT|nr:hypothetical protein Bhyg_07670 [Pseudolycoriella hygida]